MSWTTRFAGAALALGLVAGVAIGAEKAEIPPDVDAKKLKSAPETFKRSYDTADIDFKLKAVRKYAAVQHKSIAKHLMKLLKEKDPNTSLYREFAALDVRLAHAEGVPADVEAGVGDNWDEAH